jgi:two-component system sensor histidine kinase UhpB
MKSRSLLAQVLAVNLLLVAVTVLVATLALNTNLGYRPGGREAIVFGLATVATLMANWLLLHRRFSPLDELISEMERADLAPDPGRADAWRGADSAETRRLAAAFRNMMARLEAERREAGRAVIEAQERERERIARDLHDEVNQALTAVSLRLQASIEQAPSELRAELLETKRLSGQAMEELLAIARSLRPAVLDDHGLLPALTSQVRQFRDQTGIATEFELTGTAPELSPEQQLVLYRVTQECLSNVVQHAGAEQVHVSLSFNGEIRLVISDDGSGFAGVPHVGLGLTGMRERALLVGGSFSVQSGPESGTRVELVLA